MKTEEINKTELSETAEAEVSVEAADTVLPAEDDASAEEEDELILIRFDDDEEEPAEENAA